MKRVRNLLNNRGSLECGEIVFFVVCGLSVLFLVGLLFIEGWHSCDVAWNRYEVVATVTDKDIKTSGDDSNYLVFTEKSNGEILVMEIDDSLLAGRWDSSNDYAAIEVGETYKFNVGGVRWEFMSWYPNIFEFEVVAEE